MRALLQCGLALRLFPSGQTVDGDTRGCGDRRLHLGTPLLLRPHLLVTCFRLREALRELPCGRRPPDGHAHDVAFDDEVVGAAQHDQMLDIVAPQQDELALSIEIVDIDDAEPRLSPATAILAGQGEPLSADPPKHDREKSEKRSDDRERDHVLDDG